MRYSFFTPIVIPMLILMSIGCAKSTLSMNTEWATLDGKSPLIIAHRGASGYLPEHTIEAYMLAIEQGADVIEPDLVMTKDNVLVARHDRHLSTTTNVADKSEFANRKRINPDPNGEDREDWWVEDFTLAEIKTLRARQPRASRPQEFNGLYEIPTFEEVLALATQRSITHSRPVGVYPETKHPGFFGSIGLDFEAPLLAALDGFEAGPIFIQSFEPEILKRLKGRTNARLVQLVYEETPGAGSNIPLADIAEYADGIGPSKDLIIQPHIELSNPIEEAHALGLTVHPWTFRDDIQNDLIAAFSDTHFVIKPDGSEFSFSDPNTSEMEYELFYYLGVDGVFTDFPDTAVRVRNEIEAPAE